MPIDSEVFVAAVVLQRAKTQLEICGCEGKYMTHLAMSLNSLADRYRINPPALRDLVEGIEANIRDDKLELAEKKLDVLSRNTGDNIITLTLRTQIYGAKMMTPPTVPAT